MSDFPERWLTSTVGAINRFSGRIVDPKTAPSVEFDLYSVPIFAEGRPEKLRGSEIGSTKQTVEPSDVLVCKINPRINRVWMVGKREERPQIASSEWIAVRAPEFEARFLKHYFTAPCFRELVEEGVSGVGGSLTRAQPKRVATLPVPVASPQEQTRIADKLDSLLSRIDACRERLDRVPGVLKRFREAVLEVAVSGRLTEEWRNERQIRSTSPLEWRQIRFGEIVESSLYGPRFSAQDYVVDGVPTLRTSDMDSQGRLTLRNPPRVRISEEEIERLGLKDGDLVLTRTGATIGKCAVYDSSLGPALPSAYLIRFRLLQNLAVPRYVLLFLLSPIGQRLLLAGSTAVAQPNVNAQTVRRFSFSLPSHLEQIEIIRRVEELLSLADLLERKYQAAISKVEKLAPAVLAKAFRGELVPQDPNDEPASVLFERIRAEVAGPARESKHRGRARRKAVARQGSGGIGARSANRRKGRR